MEIQGWLYRGSSSQRHTITLHYTSNGQLSYHLEDDDQDTVHSFSIAELNISHRIGNTPRFIHFPNHSKFESIDNDTVDSIISAASQQGYIKQSWGDKWAHSLESNLKFITFSILILIISSYAFVQYGIPYFSKTFAMMLPAEAAAKIGKGSLDILDNSIMQPSKLSDERKQELRVIFDSLQENNGENAYKLNLVFRHSETVGANAFALPSGDIVFTDKMIEIAKNNDELKIIMLHEIGHIANRHSLRNLIQQSSLALLVVLVTGDVSSSSSMILALPSLLLNARFSQNMETEADTFALNRLARHHLNGQHFVDIMTRLENSRSSTQDTEPKRESPTTLSGYFSSHPATKERINRFKNAH